MRSQPSCWLSGVFNQLKCGSNHKPSSKQSSFVGQLECWALPGTNSASVLSHPLTRKMIALKRLDVANRPELRGHYIKSRILGIRTVWHSASFHLSCYFWIFVFFNVLFSRHQREELLTALRTDEESQFPWQQSYLHWHGLVLFVVNVVEAPGSLWDSGKISVWTITCILCVKNNDYITLKGFNICWISDLW